MGRHSLSACFAVGQRKPFHGDSQMLVGGRLSPGPFRFLREESLPFSLPCPQCGCGDLEQGAAPVSSSSLTSVGPGVPKTKASLKGARRGAACGAQVREVRKPQGLNTLNRLSGIPVFSQALTRGLGTCRISRHQVLTPSALPVLSPPFGHPSAVQPRWNQSLVEIFCPLLSSLGSLSPCGSTPL